MNQHEPSMAGEDEDSIRKAMYIMLVWTTVVVIIGIALVIFREPFASIFTFAVPGLL